MSAQSVMGESKSGGKPQASAKVATKAFIYEEKSAGKISDNDIIPNGSSLFKRSKSPYPLTSEFAGTNLLTKLDNQEEFIEIR